MNRPIRQTISRTSTVLAEAYRSLPAAVHHALILLLGLLVYANTFQAPFFFDDNAVIVNNPRIQDWGRFIGSFSLLDHRAVGYLTFALNHAVHGTSVAGYHIVNLFIHLAAAIIVYWLIALTMGTPVFGDGGATSVPRRTRRACALAAALLFVSHPVQTQAVTYIVQRFASLATLFYALTVLLYARWRLSSPEPDGRPAASRGARTAWYLGSLLSAVLALRTKETAVTLPAALALYEFLFFGGGIRKRLLPLLPFLSLAVGDITLEVSVRGSLGAVAAQDAFAAQVQDMPRLTRGEYLLTQTKVIVTYLRLLFVPAGQNVDYDFPPATSLFDVPVMASSALLLALTVLAVFLAARSRRAPGAAGGAQALVSFGVLWFLVTLSVESSIIPIDDVIMEHRVYLPSIGFLAAAVGGILLFLQRTGDAAHVPRAAVAWAVAAAVTVLSAAAHARNRTWGDLIALHEDIAAKSPRKARVHIGLGVQYEKAGLLDKAAREYATALLLSPGDSLAHYNLGSLFYRAERWEPALVHYQAVVAVNDNAPATHERIGIILFRLGRYEEAKRAFAAALRYRPDLVQSRHHLEILSRGTGSGLR